MAVNWGNYIVCLMIKVSRKLRHFFDKVVARFPTSRDNLQKVAAKVCDNIKSCAIFRSSDFLTNFPGIIIFYHFLTPFSWTGYFTTFHLLNSIIFDPILLLTLIKMHIFQEKPSKNCDFLSNYRNANFKTPYY